MFRLLKRSDGGVEVFETNVTVRYHCEVLGKNIRKRVLISCPRAQYPDKEIMRRILIDCRCGNIHEITIGV